LSKGIKAATYQGFVSIFSLIGSYPNTAATAIRFYNFTLYWYFVVLEKDSSCLRKRAAYPRTVTFQKLALAKRGVWFKLYLDMQYLFQFSVQMGVHQTQQLGQ
jgi:hypothetical protein